MFKTKTSEGKRKVGLIMLAVLTPVLAGILIYVLFTNTTTHKNNQTNNSSTIETAVTEEPAPVSWQDCLQVTHTVETTDTAETHHYRLPITPDNPYGADNDDLIFNSVCLAEGETIIEVSTKKFGEPDETVTYEVDEADLGSGIGNPPELTDEELELIK